MNKTFLILFIFLLPLAYATDKDYGTGNYGEGNYGEGTITPVTTTTTINLGANTIQTTLQAGETYSIFTLERHTLKLAKLYSDRADIILSSVEQKATLKVNETKTFKVGNTYLSITLVNIKGGDAVFNIKDLTKYPVKIKSGGAISGGGVRVENQTEEEIEIPEITPPKINVTEAKEKTNNNTKTILLGVGLILLILIGIYVYYAICITFIKKGLKKKKMNIWKTDEQRMKK